MSRGPQVDPLRLKALKERTTWIRAHLDDAQKKIEKDVAPGAEISGEVAAAIAGVISVLDVVVQTARLATRDALILGVPFANEIEIASTDKT